MERMRKHGIMLFFQLLLLFCVTGLLREARVEAYTEYAASEDEIGSYSGQLYQDSVVGVRITLDGKTIAYALDTWKRTGDEQWTYMGSNVNGVKGKMEEYIFQKDLIWLRNPSEKSTRFGVIPGNLAGILPKYYTVGLTRFQKGVQIGKVTEATSISPEILESYSDSLVQSVRKNQILNIGSFQGDGVSFEYVIRSALTIAPGGDVTVASGGSVITGDGVAYCSENGEYIIQSLPNAERSAEGHRYTWKGWYDQEVGGKQYTVGSKIERGTTLYPQWEEELLQYPVQCIDIFGADLSGKRLGTDSWNQGYGTVASGSQAGCIPTADNYYEGLSYQGCTSITVGVSGNVVYRFFDYGEYPVMIIDKVADGPNTGKILGTVLRLEKYLTDVAGGVLGSDLEEGKYYPGYRYSFDTSVRVSREGGTVYRYFEPVTYRIVFQGNGANKGSMTAIENCRYDEIYELTENAYEKTFEVYLDLNAEDASCQSDSFSVSQKFAGWSEQPEGGVRYSDRSRICNLSAVSGEKNLYAVWKPSETVIKAEPVRMGYQFAGWSANPQAESGRTEFSLEEDTTLYAVWKPAMVKYHVEYYRETLTGTFDLAAQYEFSGYTGKEVSLGQREEVQGLYPGFSLDMGSSSLDGTIKGDGSLILSAWYRRDSYELGFDLQGGELPEGQKLSSFSGKFEQEIEVPEIVPVKNGYDFGGWTDEPNGNRVFCRPGDCYRIPNHRQTLYAIWNPYPYKVVFDRNMEKTDSGEDAEAGMMESLTAYYGAEVELPECTWFQKGYEFAGWNTRKDLSGIHYEDGAVIESLFQKKNGTVTLFAEWRPIRTTIYFEKNTPEHTALAVTGSVNAVEYQYDGEYSIGDSCYQLQGYYFMGWNTKQDGSGTMFQCGDSLNNAFAEKGEQHLYAIWKARQDTEFTLILLMEGLDPAETPSMEKRTLTGTTDSTVKEAVALYYQKELGKEPVSHFVQGFEVENTELLDETKITGDGETAVVLSLKRRSYQVQYVLDLEKYSAISAQDVLYGETITLPEEFEETGKIARFCDEEENVYIPGESLTVSGNLRLMPQHKIEYHIGKEVETGYAPHGKTVRLQKPEEKAYYFQGWYWDKECTEYAGGVEPGLAITEDIVLFAGWSSEKITYKIQYDLGDYGNVVILDGRIQEYQYGQEILLPAAAQILLPEGYEFVGWYERSDLDHTIIKSISAGSYGDKMICLYLKKKIEEIAPEYSPLPEKTAEPLESSVPVKTPSCLEVVSGEQKGNESFRKSTGKRKSVLNSKKKKVKFRKGKFTYQVIQSGTGARQVQIIKAKKKIRSVKIPETVIWKGIKYRVTVIGTRSFYRCNHLQSVTIGNSVVTIRREAFAKARVLRRVIIGKKVSVIERRVFAGDKKLKKVIFRGRRLEKIGRRVFSGTPKSLICNMPKKIIIP